MGLLTDHQLVVGEETTYGTAVTPARALPMLTATSHDVNINRIMSQGLIVGGLGYPRSARQAPGIATYPLTLAVPAQSKGIGLLLSWAAGTIAHTLVSTPAYQTLLTPARSTVTPTKSFTTQLGIVETVSAGTVDPYTYAGCTVSGLTIECPEEGEATITVAALAKTLSVATGLVTPSYAAAPTIYNHDAGSATLGGTMTVPTTTTLASVASPSSANIRSWSFEIDEGLVERPIAGGYNQPAWGKPSASVKAQIEYDGVWWRTAMLAGGVLSFLGQLTGALIVSGHTETLQVAVPALLIDPGTLPKPTDGELTVVDIEGVIQNDGTNQPWYLVHKTSDTAL